jgi:Spy/CpxP family protein refolding chaperone
MRKSLLSIALASTLVCSPLAFAAANPPAGSTAGGAAAKSGQPADRAGRMGMLDQLGLTDAQRTSIRQILRQSFEQTRPEMQALRQKELAFETATPGSPAYQTATSDLAQAESNAAHAQVLRQAALRTRIYNQLTPAQRAKLAGLQAQREAKIKQWRESRRRNAPAPAASSR